ncbi:UNVERIFIED_CONTAM: hypothetical protein RMT77_009396 [Armadillidium vulgare]
MGLFIDSIGTFLAEPMDICWYLQKKCCCFVFLKYQRNVSFTTNRYHKIIYNTRGHMLIPLKMMLQNLWALVGTIEIYIEGSMGILRCHQNVFKDLFVPFENVLQDL